MTFTLQSRFVVYIRAFGGGLITPTTDDDFDDFDESYDTQEDAVTDIERLGSEYTEYLVIPCFSKQPSE